MKKLITISVALLLLLGTIGLGVNLHYCGGQLFSFSLYHSSKPCCSGNCPACKDIAVFYKLKDNFEKQTIKISTPIPPVFVAFQKENLGSLLSDCSVYRNKPIYPPSSNRSSCRFTEVFLI